MTFRRCWAKGPRHPEYKNDKYSTSIVERITPCMYSLILIISSFQVTMVTVNDGRYQYKVTCDDNEVEFSNVRFAISGQATFSLSLGGEESARRAEFTGINALVSYFRPPLLAPILRALLRGSIPNLTEMENANVQALR